MTKDFLAISHEGIEWKDDDEGVLALGHGVQFKVLYRDEESDITDMLIRLPAGYTEPRHVHAGEHHVVMITGSMTVDGKTLGPGDFVFGPSEVPHGPYEHSEECIVFAMQRGSQVHRYEGSPAGDM